MFGSQHGHVRRDRDKESMQDRASPHPPLPAKSSTSPRKAPREGPAPKKFCKHPQGPSCGCGGCYSGQFGGRASLISLAAALAARATDVATSEV